MAKNEKVLVFGASTNPDRYAHKATKALLNAGHEPVLVGLRDGVVSGISIQKGQPDIEGVDTITMYVGPKHQPAQYDYLLSLNPKRIIFNPGTENEEFMKMAQTAGVEVVPACTLVMLSLDNF